MVDTVEVGLGERTLPAATTSSAFDVSSAVRGCDGGPHCGDLIAHCVRADGTLALVVVDVAGRGPACAPLAQVVATTLLGLLAGDAPLGQAVCIAERNFAADRNHVVGQFVAVFAALLDPAAGRMRYVSAGHETALRSHAGTHEHLEATGPAFGIVAEPCYQATSIGFEPGDDLIVVTDGITDARNRLGIPFGSAGVIGAGADRADVLIEASARYGISPPDDRAALVVSYSC